MLTACAAGLGRSAEVAREAIYILDDAEKPYKAKLREAEAGYRAALAEALAQANRVEVYRLDQDDVSPGLIEKQKEVPSRDSKKYFAVTWNSAAFKILQQRELSPAEVAELLPPLRAAVGIQEHDRGLFCHDPVHGLRVWVDKDIIFQTTISWRCQNFIINYPEGREYQGLRSEEVREQLWTLFHRLLPLPEDPGAKPAATPRKADKNQANR